MIKRRHYILFLFLLVFFIGCKEAFEPDLPVVPQGYLVVEGFINAQGPTTIKLSRTVAMDRKKNFKPELAAQLRIEGDDNTAFPLFGGPNGSYSGTGVINPLRKYRLRIKTRDNKEYLSDYSSPKFTPPIDSISWAEEENGVQIYANTHDPQNKSIYYMYDYDETWEIRSAYSAYYKVDRVTPAGQIIIVDNDPSNPQIFYCWKYDTASTINVASSAKLRNDIINLHPIKLIPTTDERLGVRYSIQVRQYALDKETFQFMEQMKKNTELLGSIFDPQPSLLKGNIQCLSNPSELVIGYIYTTTVQEQRIFISRQELAKSGFNIYSECIEESVANQNDSLQAAGVPTRWPHTGVSGGAGISRYMVSDARCVDCRLRGGINVKPSFW